MDYWHFSRAAENWRSQEHEKENAMLIHDDVFSWQGFGGLFNLAAGRCRLRIFDLAKDGGKKVAFLKSVIVVVSEPADKENGYKQVSVRSCCSHIASCVADRFGIDPHRMIFIEYYPASTYGDQNQHIIDAKYEVVEFTWHGNKALHPKWKPLQPPLLDTVRDLIAGTDTAEPAGV